MKRLIFVFLIVVLVSVACTSPEGRKVRSQLMFEKGLRYYDACDFESAKQYFEWALYIDPNNQSAKEFLDACRRILVKPEEYE